MPVLIKQYSDSYIVKITFRKIKETESEGGGWYSYTGNKILTVFVSRIKHQSQIPLLHNKISDLSIEYLELYNSSIDRYENSIIHKNLLKSNCKIKP